MLSRSPTKTFHATAGVTSTRMGANCDLLPKEQVYSSPDNMEKAVFVMGHGAATRSRGIAGIAGEGDREARFSLGRVRPLLPLPGRALRAQRTAPTCCCLPNQFRDERIRAPASNRSLQRASRFVKPIFECKKKTTTDIMVSAYPQARLRPTRCSKTSKVEKRERSWAEYILREIQFAAAGRTGYCGSLPSAKGAYAKIQSKFDVVHCLRRAGRTYRRSGRVYGACRGRAGDARNSKHPGTPGGVLLQHQLRSGRRRHVSAREFGGSAEWGEPALGRAPISSRIRESRRIFARVHDRCRAQRRLGGTRISPRRNGGQLGAKSIFSQSRRGLSLVHDLFRAASRRVAIEHGLAKLTATGKARTNVVENSAGIPIQVHRGKVIYTSRPQISSARTDRCLTPEVRFSNLGVSVQEKRRFETGIGQTAFPLILTSGRLVDYEGGGERDTLTQGWQELTRRHVRRDQSGLMRPNAGITSGLAGRVGSPAPRNPIEGRGWKALLPRASGKGRGPGGWAVCIISRLVRGRRPSARQITRKAKTDPIVARRKL